jgi:two-component system nitrogen regulation response regulator NtrX
MMSGHGTLAMAVDCTKRGAFDFLEKPLQPERLLVALRNAIAARRLETERAELLDRLGETSTLLGDSPVMQRLRDEIARAGASQARILVLGENGTGKELVAQAVHRTSPRAAGPFVRLNCAAIPRELIESELFGYEKGAFTGAAAQKRGKFELANGGTLLLDEIGDMSLETQAKLLRVLEESELERVGGTETVRLDVRVVAATNKNLGDEIAHGAFREDLYHRLAVIVLRVPPLRERGGDIARLAQHFLQRACMDNNQRPRRLRPDAIEWLSGYRWPGNVRELRNMMERAAIMLDGDEIGAADLEPRSFGAAVVPALSHATTLRGSIEQHERRMLEQALAAARGNVAGAARSLGMDRANLHRKLRRLGIPTGPHRTGPHDSPAP